MYVPCTFGTLLIQEVIHVSKSHYYMCFVYGFHAKYDQAT
jgi:hypothetical protein